MSFQDLNSIQRIRSAWPNTDRRDRRRYARNWWRQWPTRRAAPNWPEHWRLINEAQGFPVGARQ